MWRPVVSVEPAAIQMQVWLPTKNGTITEWYYYRIAAVNGRGQAMLLRLLKFLHPQIRFKKIQKCPTWAVLVFHSLRFGLFFRQVPAPPPTKRYTIFSNKVSPRHWDKKTSLSRSQSGENAWSWLVWMQYQCSKAVSRSKDRRDSIQKCILRFQRLKNLHCVSRIFFRTR